MAGRDEFNNIVVNNEQQLRGVEFGGTQRNEFSFTRTAKVETNASVVNEINEEETGGTTGKNGRNTVQNNDELIKKATDASESSSSSSVSSSSSGATSASTSGASSASGAGASAGAATAGASASAAATTAAAAGTVVVAAFAVVSATPVIISTATAKLINQEVSESEFFFELKFTDTIENEKYIAKLSNETYNETQELEIIKEDEMIFSYGEFTDLEPEQDYTFIVIEGGNSEITRELLRETITTTEAHEHSYSDEWSYDETHHWHAATCEHEGEVSDKAEHTFGEWEVVSESTTEEPGLRRRTCSVCGYFEEEELPLHEHTFSDEWESDDEYHWHVATCCEDVISEKEAHDYSDWIIDTEASLTEDGSQHRICSICGYTQTDIIPMTGESTVKVMSVAEQASFDDNAVFVTLDYIDDFNKLDRFEMLLADHSGFTFIFELSTENLGEPQQIEVSDFISYLPEDSEEMPYEGGPDIMSGEPITYTFRYYLKDEEEPVTFDTGSITFEDPDYVAPFSFDGLNIGDADFEQGTFDVYVNYTGDDSDIQAFSLVMEDESNSDIQSEFTLTVNSQKQTIEAPERFDLEHGSFSYTLSAVRNDIPEAIAEGSAVTFYDVNGKHSEVRDVIFETNDQGKALANSGTGMFNVTVDYDDYFGYYRQFALVLSASRGDPTGQGGGTTGDDIESFTFYLDVTHEQQSVDWQQCFGVFDYEEITYELQYATPEDEEDLITAKGGTVSFVDSARSEITGFSVAPIVIEENATEASYYYIPFKVEKIDELDTLSEIEIRIKDPDGYEIDPYQLSENQMNIYNDEYWQVAFTSDGAIKNYIENETELTFEFWRPGEDECFHTETAVLTANDDNADFNPLGLRVTENFYSGNEQIQIQYFVYSGGYCMFDGTTSEECNPRIVFIDKDTGFEYEFEFGSYFTNNINTFNIPLDTDTDATFLSAVMDNHPFDIELVYNDGNGIQQELLCYTYFTFNVQV